MALRKSDKDLKEKLNKAIAAIRADGTWKTLSERHVPGVDLWGN